MILYQAVVLGLADSCTTSADCGSHQCCVSYAILEGRRKRQVGSFAACRPLGQVFDRKFFICLFVCSSSSWLSTTWIFACLKLSAYNSPFCAQISLYLLFRSGLAYFYTSSPFTCIFFQNLSRFFPVLAVANTWFLCRPAE